MGSDEVVFYEPLRDSERVREFWASVARDRLSLRLRSLSGTEVMARARVITAEGWLDAEMESVGPIPFRPNEILTIWIEAPGQKSFVETAPRFRGDGVLIPLDVVVNQQQKRKSFRMDVPEGFPAVFESREPNVVSRVKDLNTAGLGLEWPASAGPPPERLFGTLRLGERPPVELAGEVRFRHQLESHWTLGLRLDHALCGTEGELNELLLVFRSDVFELNKSK